MKYLDSNRIDRRWVPLWIFILCGLVTAIGPVKAAESEVADDQTGVGPWDWLIVRRDRVSQGVTSLGKGLDEWLAGEGIVGQPNETYLSVRVNQLAGVRDGYNSKVKVGGRLDLPTVSRRWKLIFESDVDELNTLQQNVLDQTTSGESIGAVRFSTETDTGWSFSHDVGIRSLAPVDPFYRFRADYNVDLNDRWLAGYNQKFWYYDSRGWGSDAEVSLIRILRDDLFLRVATEANFQDSRDATEFSQTLALHQTLGTNETLSYQVGLLGINQPNMRINDYYIQLQHRKAIYEDWLILETVPQLLVSRFEGWRPQPRLIVNLEILFFDF